MRREANNEVLAYIRALFAPEDDTLKRVAAALTPDIARMQVGAEEGKLLHFLAAAHGAKTIVEVGTLLGYSAIWMARALPEDGHLYTINKDPGQCAQARAHFAASDVADRITQMEGAGPEQLAQLTAKAPFDMMFIDADKAGYPAYLDWAEKNIRKGGLIVADNTLLFGTVYLDTPGDEAPSTWRAMRSFNERLADSARYTSTIVPTVEGLTVAVKRF